MKILSDEMPDELYEKCKTSFLTLKESYEYMKCVTNGTPIYEEQELKLPEEWYKDEDGISVLIHIDKNDYHRIVNGFANEDDAVMFETLFKNGVPLPKEYGKFIHPVIAKPKIGHWVKYCLPRCGEQHYQCTSCGYYINFGQWGDLYTKQFKYCPNCGAKMEKED